MAAQVASINLEYIPSSHYTARLPPSDDPFRHSSLSNSHNHHELHPWGPDVPVASPEFDARYAEANNQYMYHLWYNAALAPFMATRVISIRPLDAGFLAKARQVLKDTFASGIDSAMASVEACTVADEIQSILDSSHLSPDDRIFVRLGATSCKDSFAVNLPTTKPGPLPPRGDIVLRRLLTSARCVARLLALADNIWPQDPGEALIVEEWAPDIELKREFRVFCCKGRVTAVSQDIWWQKMGWRGRYSNGFVEAILHLWDQVKPLIPFDTCTMDVHMMETENEDIPWKARLIEFNGFGAHLNTGSDLFHWVNDAEILEGKRPGVTLRFVDDNEVIFEPGGGSASQEVKEVTGEGAQDPVPDWLALEQKLRERYGNDPTEEKMLTLERKTKVPLRGRWCSAY
ncbi:hypothetical protein A1O3_09391 [Capronia epimyces CBS 606.96]|uniref:Uncharacterized protein n=1 Tax=Capronia epimyces CBS 606.96 TaxID=1182542 RepID=W9XLL8_9EURO|nr:uncharacterized protein A1O3_09391 [Capronia epimyces CBS 606.96]EXJ78230.1 hypothetical protein A1O3_09391 [Capronia epimyces CBS 606.96]